MQVSASSTPTLSPSEDERHKPRAEKVLAGLVGTYSPPNPLGYIAHLTVSLPRTAPDPISKATMARNAEIFKDSARVHFMVTKITEGLKHNMFAAAVDDGSTSGGGNGSSSGDSGGGSGDGSGSGSGSSNSSSSSAVVAQLVPNLAVMTARMLACLSTLDHTPVHRPPHLRRDGEWPVGVAPDLPEIKSSLAYHVAGLRRFAAWASQNRRSTAPGKELSASEDLQVRTQLKLLVHHLTAINHIGCHYRVCARELAHGPAAAREQRRQLHALSNGAHGGNRGRGGQSCCHYPRIVQRNAVGHKLPAPERPAAAVDSEHGGSRSSRSGGKGGNGGDSGDGGGERVLTLRPVWQPSPPYSLPTGAPGIGTPGPPDTATPRPQRSESRRDLGTPVLQRKSYPGPVSPSTDGAKGGGEQEWCSLRHGHKVQYRLLRRNLPPASPRAMPAAGYTPIKGQWTWGGPGDPDERRILEGSEATIGDNNDGGGGYGHGDASRCGDDVSETETVTEAEAENEEWHVRYVDIALRSGGEGGPISSGDEAVDAYSRGSASPGHASADSDGAEDGCGCQDRPRQRM